MRRVQAGDLEAFAHLVERFQNMVYGLACSILRRREDAEEAAQDAFLKLYRARDSFDETKKLEPWLLRIAGNASRDKLRRRRVAEPARTRQAAELPDLADPRTVGRGEHDGLDRERVQQALADLSEKVRVPLELKYLRGLTNAQIAASLEVSVSNVKVQIARGKDILASRLGDVVGRNAAARNAAGRNAAGRDEDRRDDAGGER